MLVFSHLGGEKIFIIAGKNKIFYQVVLPKYLVGKNQQQQRTKQKIKVQNKKPLSHLVQPMKSYFVFPNK